LTIPCGLIYEPNDGTHTDANFGDKREIRICAVDPAANLFFPAILGDEEAQQLISKEYRSPWLLPAV
jgi:hypothetical protein